MNFNKFINSDYLKENPLCGINTYKDELNLATGVCTRKIKKLVLTGEENWSSAGDAAGQTPYFRIAYFTSAKPTNVICTHYISPDQNISVSNQVIGVKVQTSSEVEIVLIVRPPEFAVWSVKDFKSYLAAQYAAGTPVIVWYVLTTPTTEILAVPSGLSGTEEGYLIQDGTPTPTNPIYPMANTVEKWFDLNHYIMGTSADTITTLPAVLYPNDTTATVGLKGNTIQSGTPTPDNPIMPQGTGERTGNLFDGTLLGGYYTGANFNLSGDGSIYKSIKIYLTAGTYTFSWDKNVNVFRIIIDGSYSQTGDVNITTYTITTTIDGYVGISFRDSTSSSTIWDENSPIMLNTGSTTLPYEPYGYKIPISSASTTTPVYLGEVETTRKIRKLVLTGNETVAGSAVTGGWIITNLSDSINNTTGMQTSYCSHYLSKNNGAMSSLSQGEMCINTQVNNRINFVTTFATAENFKAYLAAQYAAGTPVTVWYVLENEETGIVNEPIMKIGDYVDEVSNVSIPVTAGGDTLSVDTTVQPSEVTVNYKGWHPLQSVHEYDSNYTIATMQTLTIAQLQTHTISNLQRGEWS